MFVRKIRIIWIILCLPLVILFSCSKETNSVDPEAVFSTNYDGQLTIHFFHMESDQKTGESILIQTPKGKKIMIDAGTPAAGPIVDEYLDKLNIENIDLVLLSHAHMDHVGGFNTIFKTREIGKIIEPNVPIEEDAYAEYKELIEDKGISVMYGENGDVIEVEEDIVLEFLNPPKDTSPETLPWGYTNLSAEFINNLSEVIKMTYKDNTFLFTGDIYEDRETKLIESHGDKLHVDVLVAGHHGDVTSSSEPFLEVTNPEIGVIPSNIQFSKVVVDRFKEIADKSFFSWEDGNVLLVSDGKEIKTYTEKERKENTSDE